LYRYYVAANNFQGLQTQISATQIWPGIKKRGPKRRGTVGKEKVRRKKPRIHTEEKAGR